MKENSDSRAERLDVSESCDEKEYVIEYHSKRQVHEVFARQSSQLLEDAVDDQQYEQGQNRN